MIMSRAEIYPLLTYLEFSNLFGQSNSFVYFGNDVDFADTNGMAQKQELGWRQNRCLS